MMHPVEATVEDLQTEIAIDEQVVRRRLILSQVGHVNRLSPDQRRLSRLLVRYQIENVFEQMRATDRLLQRVHLLPHGSGPIEFLSRIQEFEKRFVRAGRD